METRKWHELAASFGLRLEQIGDDWNIVDGAINRGLVVREGCSWDAVQIYLRAKYYSRQKYEETQARREARL
jgi:hypothetical protein